MKLSDLDILHQLKIITGKLVEINERLERIEKLLARTGEGVRLCRE